MRTLSLTTCASILLAARTTVATVVTDKPAIASGKSFDFVIIGAGLSGLTVANKVPCDERRGSRTASNWQSSSARETFPHLSSRLARTVVGAMPPSTPETRPIRPCSATEICRSMTRTEARCRTPLPRAAALVARPLVCRPDHALTLLTVLSVNGMLWYRPTRAEIDKLETLGNPGWNWNTLGPVHDQKNVCG